MSDVIIDELLVFSDHHAHSFTYGAKELPHDGVLTNSRLLEACSVIKQMHAYADEHDIKTVVFGGDLFHTRDAVSTDAYNLTMYYLYPFLEKRTSFFLPGNHDYFDREGMQHSLEHMKYWNELDLHVKDWHNKGWYEHHGKRGDLYTLCFVPYTESRKNAVSAIAAHAEMDSYGPKILFAHLGMQGAKVGSDYVLVNDGDISVDDVPYKEFAGCLFGHYHQHQRLFQNGWYIGATHQHNWGDVNTKRGFLHVRVYLDYIDFDFIESDAAKFIALNKADLATATIRPKDFVRVFTDKKVTEKEAKVIREQAANCEIVHVPADIKLNAIKLDEQHLSPSAMVETWVTAHKDWLKEHMPTVDDQELIDYGRMILSKVQDGNE